MPYELIIEFTFATDFATDSEIDIVAFRFRTTEDFNDAVEKSHVFKNTIFREHGTVEKTKQSLRNITMNLFKSYIDPATGYTKMMHDEFFKYAVCLFSFKNQGMKCGLLAKKQRPCKVCEAMTTKKCSCCRKTYYCCRDHQVSDWQRHKKQIATMRNHIEKLDAMKDKLNTKMVELEAMTDKLNARMDEISTITEEHEPDSPMDKLISRRSALLETRRTLLATSERLLAKRRALIS